MPGEPAVNYVCQTVDALLLEQAVLSKQENGGRLDGHDIARLMVLIRYTDGASGRNIPYFWPH